MDSRIKKMASIIVNYSCKIKKGEKVLIECIGTSALDLVKALIEEIYKAKGIPFVIYGINSITREILKECNADQLKAMADYDLYRMKEMNAYIGIRAHDNVNELSDIDSEKMKMFSSNYSWPVAEYRIKNTKWVVLRWPNNSMAQLANTSLESFENFYFDVCNLNYKKMSKAMDALVNLMQKTDIVRLKGIGTDLTFSIKGIPAIKCAGEMNIPDGEVFTAPVKNSVNGKITFNTPAIYQGFTFENICFEFKDGKIINATSNNTERLNKILDTDEGSRYIGEFSFGVNPYITKPMKDGLFDEKISGSIHFTPGSCYDEAPNDNHSSIHWDLVYIQTPEYGGGEIYFDGKLIRKDGKFVIDELLQLNPENLK
ncbi:MAG: aminopeptidase [Actinobacteria bacterium]|nr:aminopeptidase [Cyanobacteriota bacterium]MCL5772434.1 aminopeptidase [Actinomycetota bacterium]